MPSAEPVRLTPRDVLVVLQLPPGADLRAEEARLQRQLRRHYADVLGDVAVVTRAVPAGRALVAAVVAAGRDVGPLPWVWGLAVGAHGLAGTTELAAVLAAPAPANALLGSFVAVGADDRGVRLVTGADVVHTLARCDGPAGTAWATKSWAALIAAGAPARLALDRVPEFVLHDQVWGDDELLAGPALVDEAACIDLTADGAGERSWWPLAERVGPGPAATDGLALRSVLTEDLRRIAAVPDLRLALTAGRDSTLVALALADAGAQPLAYTFGGPGSPDYDGAAATAAALQWPHVSVPPGNGPPRGLDALVRATGWTEGLDTAWNGIGAPLQWPAGTDGLHVSGSGGETGRAFYYAAAAVPTTAAEAAHLLTSAGHDLPAAARDALTTRLEATTKAAYDVTGDAARALDVLYARTRMRSWLNRTVPRPGVCVLSAFTGPAVVRALLDLPLRDRLTGAGFDAALGPRGQSLRAAASARRGWRDQVADAALTRTAAWSGQVRGAHRAHGLVRRLTERVDDVGPRLLHGVVAQLPDGPQVTREVLGAAWWDRALAAAPRHGWARRQLWNALAVEALALRLAGWSADPTA